MRQTLLAISTALVLTATACGGSSPTEPTTNNAACSQPAYPVTALRWESFPIRVYIEEPELVRRGYSTARITSLVQIMMNGLGAWSAATGGRVGSISRTTDFNNSQLNIVFRNGTGNTLHDSVQGEFIRRATILWDVDRWEQFSDRDHRHLNGMAHEMGHVLGIVSHPTTPGSLMIDAPEQLSYSGPQTIDVNSILNKYGRCF
jgi:hypothetical protein